MKHLLDVNALIAWRHARAPQYHTFHSWVAREGVRNMFTCAHAELGFIRVSMQVFNYSLADAQKALAEMKRQAGGFVKAAPSPVLPAWSATPKQTSDGYLFQLATAEGMKLATFDHGIPGAVLIH